MIFDDDDDGAPLPPLLPAPQERSTLLDVCVMGVVSGVAVLLTQGAMWLCSPQFGIADLGDFVAHLTPESVSANVYALRWLQGIGTVGMFVVPSLLFAHFFYGLGGYRYLLADKLPRFANVVSGAVWFAVALPLLQFVIWLNEQVPLPAMLQTAAHTTDITV